MELTQEQKALHFETWEHIYEVQKLLLKFQTTLGERALLHDQSKINSPQEYKIFAEFTPKLKTVEYGSEEYKECLLQMEPAIRHHYSCNPHHPEGFSEGIDGMTLIDILEMLCDWKAATLRTKDGDIEKSLKINKERFNISDQLLNILQNTVDDYF